MLTRPSWVILLVVLVLGAGIVGCGGEGGSETPATMVAAEVVEPAEVSETPTAVPASSTLFFRNGLVVTATGEEPIQAGAVLIEDGLITAVGPETDITVPDDAVIIDLAGKTIMPGLIDARASDLLNRLEFEGQEINSLYAGVYLEKPVGEGVTTVRAVGWAWDNMQNLPQLRTAIDALGNQFPEVVLLGTTIGYSEGSAVTTYYPDQTVGVGTVEEAQQMTETFIGLGVDQVNFMMSSGPALQEAPEERAPVLSLEQIMAVVETAHGQDKLVVAQAIFAEEAMTAVNGGVDELMAWPTPIEAMPDDLVEALVSGQVPVLSGFSVAVPPEGDVRRFMDAGGILVFGTFAPNSGSNPGREFGIMELMGMTPMEMILSATANAANAVGLGDVIGTLEVGKEADVIVVDGNPFEDDFSSTMEQVVYVVNNGELVVQEQ